MRDGLDLFYTGKTFIQTNYTSHVEIYSDIGSMKKIELHRHFEGCITPEFLRDYLPKYHPNHELLEPGEIERLFTYSNFTDFLNSWSKVMKLMTEEEMFRDLAKYVVTQLKRENIVYAELIFSPQPFDDIGLDMGMIFDMMYHELESSGIKTKLIIDFVRNFGPEQAWQSLDKLIQIRRSNINLARWIVAVSIGGDEVNYPAELFSTQFAKARENNFNCYAHAGEWSGAESVWNAVKKLGVQRIGHGINSIQDRKLVTHLKEKDIGLDISITSNYLTSAVNPTEEHPVKQIFNEGIKISINTDDPGFFHTDLNQEYQKFINMGFSKDDLKKIIDDAISMSFLSDTEKEEVRSLVE